MPAPEGISPITALSPPLRLQSGATVKETGHAKLREMATELEATFLGMLLKEMRETLDPDSGGLFPGDTGDVYGGLFDLYLGRHLAQSGGVGMAAALMRQLQPPPPASTTTTTNSIHALAPRSIVPPASATGGNASA
jgi:flagellar protein FlgJ